MRKPLLTMAGLCALAMLLAGSVAAQAVPPDRSHDSAPTGLYPQGGRDLTHSVLGEFASPTG